MSPFSHPQLLLPVWTERHQKAHFLFRITCLPPGASLVAQMVKHLPATRETWVRPLGQEDSLEKAMATYSSTVAWKIPWMEEPGGL